MLHLQADPIYDDIMIPDFALLEAASRDFVRLLGWIGPAATALALLGTLLTLVLAIWAGRPHGLRWSAVAAFTLAGGALLGGWAMLQTAEAVGDTDAVSSAASSLEQLLMVLPWVAFGAAVLLALSTIKLAGVRVLLVVLALIVGLVTTAGSAVVGYHQQVTLMGEPVVLVIDGDADEPDDEAADPQPDDESVDPEPVVAPADDPDPTDAPEAAGEDPAEEPRRTIFQFGGLDADGDDEPAEPEPTQRAPASEDEKVR